jgi:hypothetical protein
MGIGKSDETLGQRNFNDDLVRTGTSRKYTVSDLGYMETAIPAGTPLDRNPSRAFYSPRASLKEEEKRCI